MMGKRVRRATTMAIRVGAGILAALVLAGCGAGVSPGQTSTLSPSPERLCVIPDYPQSSPETTPTILHLVRLDGTEVKTLSLKPNATTTTARGAPVFAIERNGAPTAVR